MGYSSYYDLKVHSDRSTEIIAQLREENEDANDAFDETGNANDEIKWYDSDEEIKAFSLKHPGVLFELDRQGEDRDDNSVTYFKDGKMAVIVPVITWPKFDESNLK
jgi:hypothetical protein